MDKRKCEICNKYISAKNYTRHLLVHEIKLPKKLSGIPDIKFDIADFPMSPSTESKSRLENFNRARVINQKDTKLNIETYTDPVDFPVEENVSKKNLLKCFN